MLRRCLVFDRRALLIAGCVACGKATESSAGPDSPPASSVVSSTPKASPSASASNTAFEVSDASLQMPFDRADCRSPQAKQYFFPERSLVAERENASADLMMRDWYTQMFARMSEPSLSCATPARESYRLLVLPTWGAPLAIRIEGTALVFVLLDGQAGYGPGVVAQRSTRRLRGAEQRAFAAALARADFWTTPPNNFDDMGFDGTTWVFEGRAGGRYRVVQRWQPHAGGFWELARLTVRLAGCRVDEVSNARQGSLPHCAFTR